MMIKFVYNDGGRSDAGFKGTTGDCGVRAIAIAAQMPYKEVYKLVNSYCPKGGRSSSRKGISRKIMSKVMLDLGWRYVSIMKIGSGCTVHLSADELPQGRIICNVSKHYCAVINGVLYDLTDCSRGGTRCVYSYWIKEDGKDGFVHIGSRDCCTSKALCGAFITRPAGRDTIIQESTVIERLQNLTCPKCRKIILEKIRSWK